MRVNQIGFAPVDSKSVIAISDEALPKTFDVISAENGISVFQGKAEVLKEVKWGKLENFAQCDFSAVKTPGRYWVEFGSVRTSSFDIGPQAFASLPDECLEFMREQRCGYNPFLDHTCHTLDGRTAYGPLTNGTVMDATGGWHDAGDLLKYLLTSGNATAQLLTAHLLYTNGTFFHDTVRADGRLGTNGLPDVLDEAKWGLMWMLKLHPTHDQFYHQVADDRDHAGWRLPQEDPVDYGWGKGRERVVYFADGKPQGLKKYQSASTGIANLAGRYAAAMAQGYLAFKDRDAAFASKCLTAGEEVYRLGRTNEGVQQGNSYSSPYRYEESTWADDMEWGAAELFAVTHRPEYLADAIHYAPMAGSESWMGRTQTHHYQYYPFMNLGHFALYPFADRALRAALAGYYREGIARCVEAGKHNPFHVGVPFIWCSNNLLVALITQCALYESMTGDHQFHEFMIDQRDWLLGRNPWGTSMFTGIPEKGVFPHHPHLMTTELTGKSVRGALVDGPVYDRIFKTLKYVSAGTNDPFARYQAEEAVYHDSVHDYATNEPTMDGTASAILMWVILCGGD